MLATKQQPHSVWMSLSDLMAVLMVIFLFISIGFFMDLQRDGRQIENRHKALNAALRQEFLADLERWSAEITDDNIVRFDAPFAVGRAELSHEFEVILSEFFPRYLAVLGDAEFKNHLQEIRIEGHTSHYWAQASTPQEIYLNNMRLSQQRATNVLDYVYQIDHPKVQEVNTWLERLLRANGMAYANPIYQADGETFDPVRSRRVEFKVVTRDVL